MAIAPVGKKWTPGTPNEQELLQVEYLCDTDADFASLPESVPGSRAVSAETGNLKIVNASGQWVDFLKAGE